MCLHMSEQAQEPAKPLRSDGKRFPSSAERMAKRRAIDPDKPLTKRERVIIAEFAKDLNLSGAVARSGLLRNPDKRANEIKQRANVAKALERVVEEREKASEVSVERIVKQYSTYAFHEGTGPILHSHVLQALEMLAKWKRMTAPESVVTVPVQFTFIAAPELVQDGKLVEAQPTLALTTDSREKPR